MTSTFVASSSSPRNSTIGDSRSGRITASKYGWSAGSTFAPMRSVRPAASATRIAVSSPFSGDTRPTNARYAPGAGENG
jgi:hypothetical protein